jgi:uncharacterized repeat protein (TIGR03809 family)
MPVMRFSHRLIEAARRWRDFAERRMADLAELHCSGRWRRYYAEDRLLADLQEAARAIEVWSELVAKLSEGETQPSSTDPDRRAVA